MSQRKCIRSISQAFVPCVLVHEDMEQPYNHNRWRIADVQRADQNQALFLFNTDHSVERGGYQGWKAVIFPPRREGEIPVWLNSNNNVAALHQSEVWSSGAQKGRRAFVIEVHKCHRHHKKYCSSLNPIKLGCTPACSWLKVGVLSSVRLGWRMWRWRGSPSRQQLAHRGHRCYGVAFEARLLQNVSWV